MMTTSAAARSYTTTGDMALLTLQALLTRMRHAWAAADGNDLERSMSYPFHMRATGSQVLRPLGRQASRLPNHYLGSPSTGGFGGIGFA